MPKYNLLEVRLEIVLLVRGGLVRGYIFFSGEVGEVPGRVTLVLPFLSSPKLTLLVSASGLSLLSFGVLSGAIIQSVEEIVTLQVEPIMNPRKKNKADSQI